MKKFDAIVIGAGQAGIPLAKKLAKAGKKVALIEKRIIGGTCINDGCSPTKTMIFSARVAHIVKNSERWGVKCKSISIDYDKVYERKQDIVTSFRNGAIKGLKKTKNLTIIMGEGSFQDQETLKVKTAKGNIEISGKQIFINTGASPLIPKLKGIEETDYLTSTTLLELKEIPKHLVIIGGGYIALELGQMMNRFGAKVTILEQSKTLLPHEDEDVCVSMTEIFKKENIEIHTNSKVSAISGKKQKKVMATVNGKKQNFLCSHILIAAGRKPQTENLNLKAAGVKTDNRGHILVDNQLRTATKNIYALGDVKGGPAFTHVAYNDHLIIYDNLINKKSRSIKNRLIPYCMFTDPQMGRVGITEREAKKQKLNYKVATLPMRHVARADETGETLGFMKAIVDAKTKEVLGATIIGAEGGEVMSVLQMAMMGRITYPEIRHTMFAHPLFSESLNNLFMSLDD
ncbi:dihydrolipoyl dehydrogenase [Pedobacter arcticus]|uniref:dihydrolipoyl dehydrogenase n=1 Tax=Pedobacter arcticus TaxID=752140 RepID=UPI0002DA9817|nr:dihydrolipoyl dehydrogenase [Pedobacter arcticus]